MRSFEPNIYPLMQPFLMIMRRKSSSCWCWFTCVDSLCGVSRSHAFLISSEFPSISSNAWLVFHDRWTTNGSLQASQLLPLMWFVSWHPSALYVFAAVVPPTNSIWLIRKASQQLYLRQKFERRQEIPIAFLIFPHLMLTSVSSEDDSTRDLTSYSLDHCVYFHNK